MNMENKLFITTDHHGKMKGLASINTSTTNNIYCQKSKAAICQKCYAKRLESIRPNLVKKYAMNGDILSKKALNKKDIPKLNFLYVRLHAYGELINKTHYNNFCKIAAANPKTTFVLWTKRKNLVDITKTPTNLLLIYSNLKINCDAELPEGFSKTFNVYDKAYLKNNEISINCIKSCRSCMLCYTTNDIQIIREYLR